MNDLQTGTDRAPPAADRLLGIKNVIAAFLILMKNYALYPQQHDICRRSLDNAAVSLGGWLEREEPLRMEVEKDRLVFEGEEIHREPPTEGSLPYTLFRDGIRWVAFARGIDAAELSVFFSLLNRYRVRGQDAGDDLATALWEADFSCIAYEADDGFTDSEALINLADLRLGDPDAPPPPESPEELGSESLVDVPVSIASPDVDRSLWELSPGEMQALEQMVFESENREETEEMLEVLEVVVMVMLAEETTEADLDAILTFLKDELRSALETGRVQWAYRLMERLYGLTLAFEIQKPWAVPLLQGFFRDISEPAFLVVLRAAWQHLDSGEDEQRSVLGGMLVLLPPGAIRALAPLLGGDCPGWAREQLVRVIATLGARAPEHLEGLLQGEQEPVVRHLVDVLGRMSGKQPFELLVRALEHPAAAVRCEALRVLGAKEAGVQTHVYPLLNDPQETVRCEALHYYRRHPGRESEELLLRHAQRLLQERRPDQRHLLECFRVLGACATEQCCDALRLLLLGRPWLPGARRSLARQCAAAALGRMETESARIVLARARRSPWPGVRRAVRRQESDS